MLVFSIVCLLVSRSVFLKAESTVVVVEVQTSRQGDEWAGHALEPIKGDMQGYQQRRGCFVLTTIHDDSYLTCTALDFRGNNLGIDSTVIQIQYGSF